MKFGSFFIVASLAVGGYAWCMHKRSIDPRVLHFDSYFSAAEQDAICRDIAVRPMYPAHTLSDSICQIHPAIKQIRANIHPNQQEIVVSSWRPVARINEDSLLIENGTIVTAHAYHESCVQTLPSLEVPNVTDVCAPILLSCVQQADAATWSAGVVTWLKQSRVEMQLTEPAISMVCTSEQLKETSKLINCVRQVCKTHPSEHFDVRFEKQIIALSTLQKKEDECHG